MKNLPWAWLGLLAVLGFWMLGAYNRVMALRAGVVTAWAQLDAVIQLRQQSIGALVDAAEPSLASERATFDALVAAQVRVATSAEVVRRRPTTEEPLAVLGKSEVALAAALARVVALVDNDTSLRQEAAVAGPLAALGELGPRERFARQGFNDAASLYNAALSQFPTRLLNRVFGFQRAGTL